MNIINRFRRSFYAFSDEFFKPKSFVKGEKFEDYVRDFMFPPESYDLIYRTPSFISNSIDFSEESLNPDFKFRDKKNGNVFYVEAKWRAGYYNKEDKINWCNSHQLTRYKNIDKTFFKVFIALGFGDNPYNPESLIFFPINKCNFTGLYDSFMDEFEFYLDKPIFSNYLWNL